MNNTDDLRFKIIKENQEKAEVKKIDQQTDLLANLLEEKKKSNKINLKLILLILLPIIILTIGISMYYFGFLKKNNERIELLKKENITNNQKENDIYQIFSQIINTSTIENSTTNIEAVNYDETTTPSIQIAQNATNEISTSILSTINTSSATITETTSLQLQLATISVQTKDDNKSETSSLATEPHSPQKDQIIDIKIREINNQQKDSDFVYLDFPILELKLNEINDESFKKSWLELLKIQKKASEIYRISFLFNNEPLSCNFLKNYFLKPSFIEEKFKNNFLQGLSNDECYFLFYYTHTRKFPVLLFKINNDIQIVPFMRLWDKETLIKDLIETIFVGLPKGNLVRNFSLTETFEGIDYKIFYFDNDYKLIWTFYKNYLIISTSLSAFKYLVKNM
ncbi:MAG: hypothetical protein KatS3mg095_0016 [Candidatus Parcubacteria bacterium]|nr:MAG: hypothetical protein KatS3mg095_0016 [Candidatus Parcubacteria bacterium]